LPNKQFKASCKIYNLNGIPIRTLSSNEIFDQELSLNWDGANDNGFRMPVGVYPVILEILDSKDGNTKVEKGVIVIGR
jgi:flagellar hook assembly protein FlgD